jgi:hypothetical protein
MKQIYYANFSAKDGTTMAETIQDTDKARLLRTIREIAKGNHFAGNAVDFWVVSDNIFIYYGTIDHNGRTSYLIKNQELQ